MSLMKAKVFSVRVNYTRESDNGTKNTSSVTYDFIAQNDVEARELATYFFFLVSIWTILVFVNII